MAMKVLWTANILFPEAKALLEGREMDLASSGGWLVAAAEALASKEDIELHVACPAAVTSIQYLKGERIHFHLFPGLQSSGEPFYGDKPELDSVFRTLIESVKPDIIDIHGSEYAHSLSCLRAAGDIPTVLTLQGFLHECAEHYHDGLSKWTILSNKRLFKKGILQEEESFRSRGEVEKRLLSQVRHFIGRTEWDKACSLRFSPEADYHSCNESLRDAFYEGCWRWEDCRRHSIFISQGSYPLKGLHQMLKAIPGILEKYPDTIVYIGGAKITEGRIKHLSNYGRIIASMIRRYHLSEHILFTGALGTSEMKEQFLKANVFVCPSSIENSSNSLAEAQILGVPCVASRRGGTPSLIPNERMGLLYDFDDTAALGSCICRVFESYDTFDNALMRQTALERHDRRRNCEALVRIYNEIIKNG